MTCVRTKSLTFGGVLWTTFMIWSVGCAPAETDDLSEPGATVATQVIPSANDLSSPDEVMAKKDPETLREDAEQALASGDHQAASLAARAGIRQQPNDPANIFLMATVLASQHRYHEAVRMLDHLAQRVPEANLPVLGQTAEWLVMQGDWKLAEARFREVIDAAPQAAIAHRQLAQLLLRQGRRVEAAGHLRQLCRLGDVSETELLTLLTISQPLPENPDRETDEPIGALGEAWSLVSQQRWTEAIKRLQPDAKQNASHYGLLGRIYVERDDAKALSDWVGEIAMPSWQTAPELQLAIGADQLAAQDDEAAVESLKLAVQFDETDYRARALLAEAFRERGDNAEHEKTLAEAEAILRTQNLAAEIQAGGKAKAPLVQDLIAALQTLDRPFEVFAWQVLQTIYQSGLSDEAKQQRINAINAQRLELLQS